MTATSATSTVSEAIKSLGLLTSEQLLVHLGKLVAEEQQVRATLRLIRARERAERVAAMGEGSRNA